MPQNIVADAANLPQGIDKDKINKKNKSSKNVHKDRKNRRKKLKQDLCKSTKTTTERVIGKKINQLEDKENDKCNQLLDEFQDNFEAMGGLVNTKRREKLMDIDLNANHELEEVVAFTEKVSVTMPTAVGFHAKLTDKKFNMSERQEFENEVTVGKFLPFGKETTSVYPSLMETSPVCKDVISETLKMGKQLMLTCDSKPRESITNEKLTGKIVKEVFEEFRNKQTLDSENEKPLEKYGNELIEMGNSANGEQLAIANGLILTISAEKELRDNEESSMEGEPQSCQDQKASDNSPEEKLVATKDDKFLGNSPDRELLIVEGIETLVKSEDEEPLVTEKMDLKENLPDHESLAVQDLFLRNSAHSEPLITKGGNLIENAIYKEPQVSQEVVNYVGEEPLITEIGELMEIAICKEPLVSQEVEPMLNYVGEEPLVTEDGKTVEDVKPLVNSSFVTDDKLMMKPTDKEQLAVENFADPETMVTEDEKLVTNEADEEPWTTKDVKPFVDFGGHEALTNEYEELMMNVTDEGPLASEGVKPMVNCGGDEPLVAVDGKLMENGTDEEPLAVENVKPCHQPLVTEDINNVADEEPLPVQDVKPLVNSAGDQSLVTEDIKLIENVTDEESLASLKVEPMLNYVGDDPLVTEDGKLMENATYEEPAAIEDVKPLVNSAGDQPLVSEDINLRKNVTDEEHLAVQGVKSADEEPLVTERKNLMENMTHLDELTVQDLKPLVTRDLVAEEPLARNHEILLNLKPVESSKLIDGDGNNKLLAGVDAARFGNNLQDKRLICEIVKELLSTVVEQRFAAENGKPIEDSAHDELANKIFNRRIVEEPLASEVEVPLSTPIKREFSSQSSRVNKKIRSSFDGIFEMPPFELLNLKQKIDAVVLAQQNKLQKVFVEAAMGCKHYFEAQNESKNEEVSAKRRGKIEAVFLIQQEQKRRMMEAKWFKQIEKEKEVKMVQLKLTNSDLSKSQQ